MASVADTFFTCRETPVYCPSGLTLSDIPGSPTTKLRLSSQLAGPGNIAGPYNGYYYNINENPTTALHLNGIMYNLVDSVMTFPGTHVVVGFSKPCDAELILKFQPSQQNVLGLPPILFCIPVQSGVRLAASSVKYFQTLSNGPSSKRPTLTDVLPRDAGYLNYQGFSVLELLNNEKCSALTGPQALANYIICQVPIGMALADFNRFRAELPMTVPPPDSGIAPVQKTLPPIPSVQINTSRFIKQTARIVDVVMETGDAAPGLKKNEKGIPVPSMKCQPVKQKGVAGKLSIDMTGRKLTTSLEDELNDEHAELGDGPGAGKCVRNNVGVIEWRLSVFLGLVLGIAVCSFIAYFVKDHVFKIPTFGSSGPIKPLQLPSFTLPTLPIVCKD